MNTTLRQFDAAVWVQTSFIGDIVLLTGAAELLRQAAPDLPQILVTTPVGKAALDGGASIFSHVISFDKRREQLLRSAPRLKNEIKSTGVQNPVVLQVHGSARSSVLTRLWGWQRVCHEEAIFKGRAWSAPRVAIFHETVRQSMLLEPLGIDRAKIVAARPRLNRLTQAPAFAADLKYYLAGRPLIVMAPGSVWPTKMLPKETFADLAKALIARGKAVVMIGAGQEQLIGEEIRRATGDKVFDLIGKTSLAELRWLLPEASALVANDSGPIHFASALDVPTVAIFGPTVPEMGFGPLASRAVVVGASLDCRPCSVHGTKECPLTHFKCMRTITVDQLITAVDAVTL